jgi:hypothetical protein
MAMKAQVSGFSWLFLLNGVGEQELPEDERPERGVNERH